VSAPTEFKCRCGHRFPEALGAYGCPNCCGERGFAKLVPAEDPPPYQGNLLNTDPDNPA
jgi:hypothetical protein